MIHKTFSRFETWSTLILFHFSCPYGFYGRLIVWSNWSNCTVTTIGGPFWTALLHNKIDCRGHRDNKKKRLKYTVFRSWRIFCEPPMPNRQTDFLMLQLTVRGSRDQNRSQPPLEPGQWCPDHPRWMVIHPLSFLRLA